MADFSALKTSIQNYIKQNGNEEITGNLLQQVLLSMVTTLGDSAINDLVTALNNEVSARQNADGTLQGNINTLQGNINTFQGVVNGIKANIDNGYVYAGIANPSTTPASGKVFYLALTAGTYTNFGATVVPQGINILKYNGSAWSLDSFLGLDNAPTQGSNNLVKSGGVLDSIIKDGSAFDLSAYNSGTTYADLSAALTALNALPAAYKKGGMSMKFVQSSDNKYVQYFCKSQSFTINVDDWEKTNLEEEVSQLGQKVITEVAGRNLFDDTPLRSKTGITYQNGIFRGKQSAFGHLPVSGLVAGKRYIFQFEARIVEQQIETGTGLVLRFKYSDQTVAVPEYYGNANASSVRNENTDWKVYSGVTSVKELVEIIFSYATGGDNVIEIRNLMLSEGYSIKTFVQYESLVDSVAREEIRDGLLNAILSLSQKKTIDSCMVINGPYIKYTDGTRVSSGSYRVYSFDNSEFMSKYMHVKVADDGTTNASIAFYDINGNYLQAVSVQSANNPAREIIVEVPSAAIRIDICNRKVLLETPEIEFYSLADSSSFSAQSKTLHEINKYFMDMSKEKVFTLANTSLLKSNGAAVSDEGVCCSDYIRVLSGDRLDYSLLFENGNIGGLCFYNDDKVFQYASVVHTSGIVKSGTWEAAEDGYIRACTLSRVNAFKQAYLHYHNNAITLPERVEILENKLPDYWEEHLSAKEIEINTALRSVGIHGDELFFFSDYHLEQNTGWTPVILRRLIEKYKVEQIVQGGDIMNTETDDVALMVRFEQYTQAFHNINVLNVIGNHDYNPYGSLAGFGTMYPLLQKNIEHDYQCGGNSLDGYFYRDNAQQKIRYIYLNTRTNGIVATDTEQLDWFKSVLNSVGDGWYVVVFAHLVFEWYQSGDDYTIILAASGRIIKEICDGYQNKTNGTGQGVSWDFTNAHGSMACVLCGHTHIDYSIDSEAGYPIIAIDRDAIDYPPVGTPSSTRTKGTATEQAIDLVCIDTQNGAIECVRIGGGVSRSFSFDT